jgi:hypothetical protein
MYAFTIKASIHRLSMGLIVKPLNNAMTLFQIETITGSGSSVIVSRVHDAWKLEKEGTPCLDAADLTALGMAIEKELKISS